ncbi:MAG: formylglycine-generating enzyme family protein [Acidobacteria bacterium]|nr:formylglycine-generating enzyme family protein [Acidobacteriota bacterium]
MKPAVPLSGALLLLAGAAVGLDLLAPGPVASGFLPQGDPRLPGMVFVPGGRFLMGSSEQEIELLHNSYGGTRAIYESEFPRRRVEVGPFYIDRTEVTQARYKDFVDATGREPPYWGREWAALYNWERGAYPEGLADHPVVLVTFEDAEAYCRWAGKSLPAEEEWEKAARGTGGRAYPWGERWDSARLNSSTSWSHRELPQIEIWTEWWRTVYHRKLRGKVVTTRPVGSYPAGASPYGALDMAGNVFEWTASWYDAYPGSPYGNSEYGQKFRVIRGGDWYLDRIYTRAAARLRNITDHRVPTIGFRCVCRPGDDR